MKLEVALCADARVGHPAPPLVALVTVLRHSVQVVDEPPADVVRDLVEGCWRRRARAPGRAFFAQARRALTPSVTAVSQSHALLAYFYSKHRGIRMHRKFDGDVEPSRSGAVVL